MWDGMDDEVKEVYGREYFDQKVEFHLVSMLVKGNITLVTSSRRNQYITSFSHMLNSQERYGFTYYNEVTIL